MLSRLERADVWELEEKLASYIQNLSNDHSFPYQARSELKEVIEMLKPQFSELEQIIEVRNLLEKIGQDSIGMLNDVQKRHVYGAVDEIDSFVAELNRKRDSPAK